MKSTKQPSFFLVGAPKCGTTATCRYLAQHPELFIPPQKELYYFDFDLRSQPKVGSFEQYLSFFEPGKGKICGEGSTSYLRSQEAPKAIYDFNPDAKIIIMLREPVSLLYSLHSQRLYDGNETIQDFKQVLAAELDSNNNVIRREHRNKEFFTYREVVKFSEQIERYFNTFGKKQVLVIFYEDFNQNTSKTFQDILNFLEVTPDFQPEFVRVNSNKTVKSRFLLNLVKYPPSKLLEIGKYFIPLPQATRRAILEGVKEKIKRANTQFKPRSSLDSELRKTLQKEFTPEIKQLSQLLERDLTHWYQN
jgi:hypothetical protein